MLFGRRRSDSENGTIFDILIFEDKTMGDDIASLISDMLYITFV